MSFGYSVSDAVLLSQLAWKTVQNTRKACGEHDDLTQEVLGLHIVLRRLKQEISKPESPLNRSGDTYKEEIEIHCSGCSKVLRVLDIILEKYNRLSEEEKSWRKLWQKIRFGNGEIADLQDLRSKMVTKTTVLSLTLNMASLGSLGRIEKQLGDLKEMKIAVHGSAARLIAESHSEGSILSSYANDDKSVWKEFRRDLCRDGFSSSDLKRHRALIMAYIKELGDRGLFDDDHRSDRGLFNNNCSGGLKSVEELGVSNAYPATEDLMGEIGPKRSSTKHPLLTKESTSAVLHRDRSVTRSKSHLRPISFDLSDDDFVQVWPPNARVKVKSKIDTKSEHYLARTSRITSVSETPTVDSNRLEGRDISLELERKPLQSYAESVAEESMEEFDDTESVPGPQVTPVNVPCTANPPSSHGEPSVDPIESIQTNHSASNPLSTRSQRSIARTLPTESMDVELAEYKRHGFDSEIFRFYAAPNGYCLDASLLDQFEDRVHIISECQGVARRLWENFGKRLYQFVITAKVIIWNINAFLAALGPNHGSCKVNSRLADFTSEPFKVGILSSYEDGSGDLDDLGDILTNVRLWIWRFDENCGGIVFYCEDYLTSRNSSALQHPRNIGLRVRWATQSHLCMTTTSMKGAYQRPSYFFLYNEGPTSPEVLRQIRCLVEGNALQSSMRSNECQERIALCAKLYSSSPS
ncbi:hypothetical protein JMJ35_006807 [Cladonia borealis]|uniref:Fungal N-terminal domain-containing protein n=1 Tax=Cladonia borealis TaxID=184061 RepID=A0AA39V7J2_9LECA|nr:hypothetical protein JMJ35_006807 [Cladonia borealis]